MAALEDHPLGLLPDCRGVSVWHGREGEPFMSLRVLCPNGHLLEVQQQYVGAVVRCPLCGLHLMIAAVGMPVPGVPTTPPAVPPAQPSLPPAPAPPVLGPPPLPPPPSLDIPGLAPLSNDPWPDPE